VLNVGGWFDAEGSHRARLRLYRAVEKEQPPASTNDGWSWGRGATAAGRGVMVTGSAISDLGVKTAAFYREQILFPFFEKYLLKDKGREEMPEAWTHLTGSE
jgi:hypothetical protein